MPTGPKPPLAPGQGKVVLRGVNGPAEWANVMYWFPNSVSAPIDTATLNTLLDQWTAAYHTNLMGATVTQCELTEAQALFIPAAGEEVVATKSYALAGSDTSTPQPASVSAAISWAINAYYRGGHPRTYLPGIGADVINDTKTFKSTFVTGVATAASSFIAAINALTPGHITAMQFVSISFARHNAWRATPVAFAITGASVHPRIDSQRRRLGKETT